MKFFIAATAFISITLLAAGLSLAAESPQAKPGQVHPSGKAPAAKKLGASPKVKLVDINQAGKAELKTLPGVGDAEAERIIARRPYGSKYWLVERKVIPEDLYMRIKDKIIALQHVQIVKPRPAGHHDVAPKKK
jgi:competence protein ComEA